MPKDPPSLVLMQNDHFGVAVISPVTLNVNVQMKRRLSVANLSLENNLPMFGLNAPVVSRAEMKKCEQMLLFIAMLY